tara:strand:- start:100 stop:561 length:462 start_codon:yes stop_codon:yes gene_type:complete
MKYFQIALLFIIFNSSCEPKRSNTQNLKNDSIPKSQKVDKENCISTICRFPILYNDNISPREIKIQSQYLNFKSNIDLADLATFLKNNPELIQEWITFTLNIRHSPAWGFCQNEDSTWSVFQLNNGELIHDFKFSDKFEACAKMALSTISAIK